MTKPLYIYFFGGNVTPTEKISLSTTDNSLLPESCINFDDFSLSKTIELTMSEASTSLNFGTSLNSKCLVFVKDNKNAGFLVKTEARPVPVKSITLVWTSDNASNVCWSIYNKSNEGNDTIYSNVISLAGKKIIETKINLNFTSDSGYTPLFIARTGLFSDETETGNAYLYKAILEYQ